MANVKGYLAIVSAVVLCPCHLPILAAVFAGTALGGAITEHYGLFFPLTAIYFIAALVFGLRWMTRSNPAACGPCESPTESRATEAWQREGLAPRATESETAREPVGGAAGK